MSQYEQAFRDAFSAHAHEAPPLPPMPEPVVTPPRRRVRAWELVALAAAIMLVAGLGWLAIRGPSTAPVPGGFGATPSPTRASSSQSAPPSTSSTSPRPATAQVLCQVGLPAQWQSTFQAGAVPKDPREVSPELVGHPIAAAPDRYAYLALFRTADSYVGFDGAVTEVSGGKRTDVIQVNANSGYPTMATYIGDDLFVQMTTGPHSHQLIAVRGSVRDAVILLQLPEMVGTLAVIDGKLAWRELIDPNDASRVRLHVFDPATGENTTGREVAADELVVWNGLLVTARLGESPPDAPAFQAFDANLKPAPLPEPLAQVRGSVTGVAADQTTLAWSTQGQIHWFQNQMAASATGATGDESQQLLVSSVSDTMVGLVTSTGNSEGAAVLDLRTGSWTTVANRTWATSGRMVAAGPSAWGGQIGSWTAKISDLDPLPGC